MFSHEKEVSAIGFTSTDESPGQLVRPDISPTLELALTIVYTLLYTFLFVFVYVQLWLILPNLPPVSPRGGEMEGDTGRPAALYLPRQTRRYQGPVTARH